VSENDERIPVYQGCCPGHHNEADAIYPDKRVWSNGKPYVARSDIEAVVDERIAAQKEAREPDRSYVKCTMPYQVFPHGWSLCYEVGEDPLREKEAVAEVDCSNEREDGFCLLHIRKGESVSIDRGNLAVLGLRHGDKIAWRRIARTPEPDPLHEAAPPFRTTETWDGTVGASTSGPVVTEARGGDEETSGPIDPFREAVREFAKRMGGHNCFTQEQAAAFREVRALLGDEARTPQVIMATLPGTQSFVLDGKEVSITFSAKARQICLQGGDDSAIFLLPDEEKTDEA